MKYTMSYGRNEITLDTATGDIYGDTYGMKEIIKSDLYATWDKTRKVWHSDKLVNTINDFRDYLTRCYKLEAVEVEEPIVEAEPAIETTKTAKTTKTRTAKTVSRTKLVNGNDGFYQIVYYTDGTVRKVFVG